MWRSHSHVATVTLSQQSIEGKIHCDIFSLFYSLWTNPDSQIHKLIKYLLEKSSKNSRTWAIYLRNLSEMYGLEDPLIYLNRDAPSKSEFKECVITKITAFHERELRQLAEQNSLMTFFNVSLLGLRGRYYPAISFTKTTNEVAKMKPHLKMLTGNYLTYKIKSEQSGGSPKCRLCQSG